MDLCANNAFQIYRHLKENPGQKPLHLLGFQRSIIDTYYQRYRKATQIAMFPGSRMKAKVSDEVRFDKLSHWIGNDVLNVEKKHSLFVKNAKMLYTQSVFLEFHEQ